MSSLEFNKIAGAVVVTALVVTVIGEIGNALVDPDERGADAVAVASGAPAHKAATEAAPMIEAVAALLASADVAKGAKLFKKCAACHTSTNAGKNKIGPNLWDIVNSERGKKAGFRYSKALLGKAGAWTYESLNAFLAKPKGYIKGTKMAFSGIKKAGDRAALIAYLRGLSESPAPLP